MFKKTEYFYVAASIVVLTIVIVALIAYPYVLRWKSNDNFILKLHDSVLLNNEINYLPCDQLPTIDQINATLSQHSDVIERIKKVGNVIVEIGDASGEECTGKAKIIFKYSAQTEGQEIKKIINGRTFFGIPYDMVNI